MGDEKEKRITLRLVAKQLGIIEEAVKGLSRRVIRAYHITPIYGAFIDYLIEMKDNEFRRLADAIALRVNNIWLYERDIRKAYEECARIIEETLGKRIEDKEARIERAVNAFSRCEESEGRDVCGMLLAAGIESVEYLDEHGVLHSIIVSVDEGIELVRYFYVMLYNDEITVMVDSPNAIVIYSWTVKAPAKTWIPVVVDVTLDPTIAEMLLKSNIVELTRLSGIGVYRGAVPEKIRELVKMARWHARMILDLRDLTAVARTRTCDRTVFDVKTGQVCCVREGYGPVRCAAAKHAEKNEPMAPDYAEAEHSLLRAVIPSFIRRYYLRYKGEVEIDVMSKPKSDVMPVSIAYVATDDVELNVVAVIAGQPGTPPPRPEEIPETGVVKAIAKAEEKPPAKPQAKPPAKPEEKPQAKPEERLTLIDYCVRMFEDVYGREAAERFCTDLYVLGVIEDEGDVAALAGVLRRVEARRKPPVERREEKPPAKPQAKPPAKPEEKTVEEVEECESLVELRPLMRVGPALRYEEEVAGGDEASAAADLCEKMVCEKRAIDIGDVFEYRDPSGVRHLIPVPRSVIRVYACTGYMCPWYGTSIACITQRDGRVVCYSLETREDVHKLLVAYWLAHGIHPYTGGEAVPREYYPGLNMQCYADKHDRYNVVCADKTLIDWFKRCTEKAAWKPARQQQQPKA